MGLHNRFRKRSASRALLAVGLAVGLATLLYSSWWPDTGRSETEPVQFAKKPRRCECVCVCSMYLVVSLALRKKERIYICIRFSMCRGPSVKSH